MVKKRTLTEPVVIDAALALAREQGLDAVTLSSVGRRLDIKPQSMYRYADNVDDLRTKVIVSNLHEGVARLNEQLVGLDSEAAIVKLAAIITDTNNQNLQLSDLGVFSSYRHDPRVQHEFQAFYQLVAQLLQLGTSDDVLLRRRVQLVIDVLFGQAATAGVSGTNEADLTKDFEANLQLLLATFK